ncbi:MAG: CYTH domain-containing protein [bacterium]|nr:CYTH domain-containing protein [bacterium]
MIEVERKFSLTEEQKAKLLDGAVFKGEKVITDCYYDSADFSLTTKDQWLRLRNDEFELKVPVGDNVSRGTDYYNELVTESEIRNFLKLPESGSLESDFKNAGYEPFCICKTTRQKFTKDGFMIDIDSVNYPEGTGYALAEIELMVEENRVDEANKLILDFAKKFGLNLNPVRGKVIEYLRLYKPKHYTALDEAGVLRQRE